MARSAALRNAAEFPGLSGPLTDISLHVYVSWLDAHCAVSNYSLPTTAAHSRVEQVPRQGVLVVSPAVAERVPYRRHSYEYGPLVSQSDSSSGC